MPKISVIIPSRTQARQREFLNAALASARAQTVAAQHQLETLVGLDAGAEAPADIDVAFVHAHAASQAAALNACAARMTGDVIAILEDDDLWRPHYLELMLEALAHAPFVSSNQEQVEMTGGAALISDSATPSSWVMTRAAWDKVGPFDESYRYHLDVDWLGRLYESGLERIHFVEAGAPTDPGALEASRPFLATMMRVNAPRFRLARHNCPSPLVRRRRHPIAGMEQIASDAGAGAQSTAERVRLVARYGRMPL